MSTLHEQVLEDMKAVGLPTDFTLVMKPYSKTFLGRCDPNTRKIILYVYEDQEQTKPYPYANLLLTAIHEGVHHLQFRREDYKYCKGIMHNAEFHKLNAEYGNRAKALLLLREVTYHDSLSKKAL